MLGGLTSEIFLGPPGLYVHKVPAMFKIVAEHPLNNLESIGIEKYGPFPFGNGSDARLLPMPITPFVFTRDVASSFSPCNVLIQMFITG